MSRIDLSSELKNNTHITVALLSEYFKVFVSDKNNGKYTTLLADVDIALNDLNLAIHALQLCHIKPVTEDEKNTREIELDIPIFDHVKAIKVLEKIQNFNSGSIKRIAEIAYNGTAVDA